MVSGPRSGEAEERSGGASRVTREECIFRAADTRRGAEQTTPPPMVSGPRSGEAEERSGGASRVAREECIFRAADTRRGAEQTTPPPTVVRRRALSPVGRRCRFRGGL